MSGQLTSLWFSSNDRLQNCAVSDSAHAVVGDKGVHVFLIQIALNIIDDLEIDENELSSMSYGQSTAAAVLAYKRKRSILNRS